MAIRNIFKTAPRPKAEQPGDMQVDYSYTQWRHAQMQALVRNYTAACESVDGAAAA